MSYELATYHLKTTVAFSQAITALHTVHRHQNGFLCYRLEMSRDQEGALVNLVGKRVDECQYMAVQSIFEGVGGYKSEREFCPS